MKISTVIKELKELMELHGDLDAVCSADDEGNSYQHVNYTPTAGNFDGNDFNNNDTLDINSVCIN